MVSYQKFINKIKTKMNENQVFVILKIVSSFRYNHVKFLKFFIQTTFFRCEITCIIKKTWYLEYFFFFFFRKYRYFHFLSNAIHPILLHRAVVEKLRIEKKVKKLKSFLTSNISYSGIRGSKWHLPGFLFGIDHSKVHY